MKQNNDEMIFDGMQKFTNESGTFYLDESGRLMHYENTFMNYSGNDHHVCIRLIIPEGTLELPDRIFGGYHILRLILPVSLRKIAWTAFSGACIDNIILPDSLDADMMRQLAHALRFGFAWYPTKLVKSWPVEYAEIYLGKSESRESWEFINNSSGTFFIDSDSVLMEFQPTKENLILHSDEYGGIQLRELDIPMGVKAIPRNALHHLHVKNRITFPDTLKWIGCADEGSFIRPFSICELPDVILPSKLELLAPNSFHNSLIRSLTIYESLCEYCLKIGSGRRFKGSRIFKICVPIKYHKSLLEICEEERISDMIIGEISDNEVGTLFYIESKTGLIGRRSFMEHLFWKLFKADTEKSWNE